MTHPSTKARKPRLLVLASTYPRWCGDPEPGFVHELAKRLAESFAVTVLCPHAKGASCDELLDGVRVRRYRYAPEAMESLVNDGGMIANLRRQRWKWLLVPGFFIALLWSIMRLVRDIKPDVVHAHWLVPQGLAVAIAGLAVHKAPPFVVTSHGADLFALGAWPFPAIKRFVARRASAVTVVSNAMKDELTRIGVNARKVHVEPMGVDLDERFTPDSTIVRSRDEILFVGRLVEKKGLRHLIQAMPAILSAFPGASLVIAGFGPEDLEMRQHVLRLGLGERVHFLGPVRQEHLPELYRRAAVFVAPFVISKSGDQEGLGLVVAEAAGCACPVVVSKLPQLTEAWHLLNPYWAVPEDSESLASACISVMSAPKEAAARAQTNRSILAASYGWTQRSSCYRKIILRALGSNDQSFA